MNKKANSDTGFGSRITDALNEWRQFTETDGQMTRLYLTPEHQAAADSVMDRMVEAGMRANMDAVGNVVGRYEADDPDAKTLLTGSHIDTVRNGGTFDGMLGVALPIACVEALNKAGRRLPFSIEVIAFGDEEGVRFPCTMTGSLAVAGRLPPENLDHRDSNGVSLGDALRAFGGDPSAITMTARQRDQLLGFLEVHIEQGPVLETEGLPVGVVSAINGASRIFVQVVGMAGHAGTVPMALRQDALAGAAAMISAVEQGAIDNPSVVATVGTLDVRPGAINVIPSVVEFTIDVRAPNDDLLQAVVGKLEAEIKQIAGRRDLDASCQITHRVEATGCDGAMMAMLEEAVEDCGIQPRRLASGAGHDAMILASICPMSMLFVRCAGGISHHPAETVMERDMDVAAQVFMKFIDRLADREAAHTTS
ncbi:MAG: allantoate amidohydrolase [Pseudomonadota bacterium]